MCCYPYYKIMLAIILCYENIITNYNNVLFYYSAIYYGAIYNLKLAVQWCYLYQGQENYSVIQKNIEPDELAY